MPRPDGHYSDYPPLQTGQSYGPYEEAVRAHLEPGDPRLNPSSVSYVGDPPGAAARRRENHFERVYQQIWGPTSSTSPLTLQTNVRSQPASGEPTSDWSATPIYDSPQIGMGNPMTAGGSRTRNPWSQPAGATQQPGPGSAATSGAAAERLSQYRQQPPPGGRRTSATAHRGSVFQPPSGGNAPQR
ncbi:MULTISPECIES: hypothetical protein [Micromonospora]|uniref:Uncharacterized protein n=1 Tax=Micromonospora yangpuensis TaxID=683228 RepID=A0A1C6V2V9_9ACTN|nr:hypothetical protein [Micromonospora yangpuensis]GGM14596.1 hypothetical protein GCM10012279_35880 [Micromonospora yangpuensis]SCL60626.1 hypothetical protein GA0070617_4433 [Micromonospora yangpuensis]